MVSRVFRVARSDSRFDQTRIGSIVFKTDSIPIEVWKRWDQKVFTGNRARLVVIVVITTQQLEQETSESAAESPFALTNVRELIIYRDSPVELNVYGTSVLTFFSIILPNLQIVDQGPFRLITPWLGSTLA